MQKACCFFGHNTIFYDIDDTLYETICKIIEEKNISVFYSGEANVFSKKCENIILELKEKHPHIKIILIKPDMLGKFNRFTNHDIYDDIITINTNTDDYCEKIRICNKWIVKHSDTVIIYSIRDCGAVFTAVNCAKKEHKEIIRLKRPR